MTKILVVDDMAIFRDPIAASLRLAGFETVCAADGREALAALKAHRPAVVLLDLSMPTMDGISCLRAVRADPEIAETPVIVFTAHSDKRFVLEAAKLGVHDYLLKSRFSIKELLARVGKYAAVTAAAEHPPAVERAATPLKAREEGAASQRPDPPAAAPAPVRVATDDGGTTGAVPQLLTRDRCIARTEKALAAKTLSGAVSEVISLAASPRGNVSDLAPLIARDPMLSARVLQTANSAAYTSSRPVVRTIPDAVRQIGTSTVRSIAAALGIFDAMPPAAPDGFNPIRCWQHSFAVAMLCERLASQNARGRGDTDPGVLYLVGLCHDLGEILFHTHFGAEAARVAECHRQTGRRVDELEREMLGMTRGELVQVILERFGLPDAIKGPIRAFHDPAGASAPSPSTRVLRLAELYANGLLLASSGRSLIAPLTRAECKLSLGREDPTPPDATTLRSEVFYTTGVLARLSDDDAQSLMQCPYARTKARVCVVRENALSPFDPVTAALESIAQVTLSDSLKSVGPGGCDALVVTASSDAAAGFTARDVRQAAPAGPGGTPSVLWLVGRTVDGAQRDPVVAPLRWPVPLDELNRFVQGCVAGQPAAPAAA